MAYSLGILPTTTHTVLPLLWKVHLAVVAALLNRHTGTPLFLSLTLLQYSYNFTFLLHLETLARVPVTVTQIHAEQRLWSPEGAKAAEGPVPFLSGRIYLAQ